MATLRKPKKLKFPKKPKANASAEVMKNYLRKYQDVEKLNAKKLAEYNKEKREREALKKKIASK